MCYRRKLIFLLSLLSQLILIRAASNNAKSSYIEALVKDRIEEKFQLLGPRALLKNHNFTGLSGECARDLAVYERGINRQETWALQMIDSSSKLPTGIFRGNIIDIGMYDECMETRGISLEGIEISGKHCTYSINRMITLEKRIPFDPVLSICMPKTCSNNDLFQLINGSIDSDTNLKSYGMSVSSASCTNTDLMFFDEQLGIFSVVMLLYIGFLVFCSAVHVKNLIFPPEKRNETTRTLLRFSYLKNTQAIFNLKVPENDFPVIHGLRVLNTFWLVLVHEVFFHFFLPLVNMMDSYKMFSSWEALVPLMGVYSPDTFFVLSGFLIAFAFFEQRKKKIEFNIVSFYGNRLFRLAPSILALLYITIVIGPKFPLLASGPRFESLINIFIKSCNTKWIPVALLIPNLVKKDNYCLQHTWSIAVDTELMWIAPLILFALHRKPKAGLYLLMILVLSTVLSNIYILITYGYSAIYFTHEISIPVLLEAFRNMYTVPYTRATPWLVGILFGYIVTRESSKPKKTTVYVGWFLAVASFAFCAIGTKTFTSEEYEYNLLWEITFAALSKPLWGFGICWIIYASIHNPRSLIATALSSKYFLPFSRLSYSLCIIHLLLPLMQAGSTKTPRYFSDLLVLHSYVGNLMFSLVIAFLFSITYEIPMRNLGDMIFKKKKNVTQEKLKAK